MAKKQDKEVDLQQLKRDMVERREKRWDEFFSKYNGMDTVNEDEALSEYSESGRSSNGSCLLTEDEDEENNEEEEDLSDADSCIEVSDSDEEISDFKSAFKEVAQNNIQIIEKTYEEHFSDDIKTKDKTQSIRKSIKTTEKSATSLMHAKTPKALSNALQSMNNLGNLNTNNNDGGMALVPSSSVPLDQPISNVIAEVNEATACETFKQGDVEILKQVVTTTTTTTTTTIIKKNTGNQDEFGTPKNANSAKQHKSTAKKMRPTNDPEQNGFDYVDNDNDGFTTPKADRRKSRFCNTPNTPSSGIRSTSFSARGSAVFYELTPSGSKNLVTRKEIQHKLEGIPNSERSPAVRNVKAETGKRLSLMLTPRPKAIMPASANDDFVFRMGTQQRPVLAKICDDKFSSDED